MGLVGGGRGKDGRGRERAAAVYHEIPGVLINAHTHTDVLINTHTRTHVDQDTWIHQVSCFQVS